MSAEGTERSNGPAPALLWGGVGTAPVGGLLLVAGGDGFLLRVGAFFLMVAVILVAVGALLARRRAGDRGGMEGYVEEEIEALRDDLRADIAHAAKATHRSLAERVSALTDTVEALRGQIEVLRAHVERSHLNAPPAPQAPAPAPVQASAGVVHHTETVHVTRQTYVDDGGTVYGAAKPVAVPQQRREPDPYQDQPEPARRSAPVGRTEQRMGERRASARVDEHGSEMHVNERRAEVRVDPTAAEMHVEDRWASSTHRPPPPGEGPTGRRRRGDDDEPSGRWAQGGAPAPGPPSRQPDGEWAGAAPVSAPGGRRAEGEWAGAAPVSGAGRRGDAEWSGAAPVSGAGRREGERPRGFDGERTGGRRAAPEPRVYDGGFDAERTTGRRARAPEPGGGFFADEHTGGFFEDEPERTGRARVAPPPEPAPGRAALPANPSGEPVPDWATERGTDERARTPVEQPRRGGTEYGGRPGGGEYGGRPAGSARPPVEYGPPVSGPSGGGEYGGRPAGSARPPGEYGPPVSGPSGGGEYGGRPAGSARPPGEYGRPPAGNEYGGQPGYGPGEYGGGRSRDADDYDQPPPRGRRAADDWE
ncbi:hypothetical protein Val02_87210 [Virgisporangium aliadipatigenens]|uniref:Uncharacterized protein n=1 Tax=Virgisporangium aliadipatigenens TaxID=741659 RepID=A0A8J4DUZ9_9ACTN|nr:hypothetical protein [Virgisporangium aliadipatigenens]GIJ51835.1 hypothetical protein Val02_87210 [Virgisporangium aliadipatigenens]